MSRAVMTVSLVELDATEEHQRVAEQFDLDSIGITEVHRLGNPEVGSRVRYSRVVEPGLNLLPALTGGRNGDVLNSADRFDGRFES